jgi:O-antigen ligase
VVLAWLLLLAGPALLFAVQDLPTLTSLIGKDATLTGRVDLWQLVLPYGDKRPWLGYGYAAFWNENSPMTQEIWRILNSYKPPHAHNGWIETYLELGLTGCFIVAIQMIQMLVTAARGSSLGRDVDSPYMLLIVVMMLIFNMVEADLIRAPALFWPFLIIGPVAMSKIMRKPSAAVSAPTSPQRNTAGLWPPRPIIRPYPAATR